MSKFSKFFLKDEKGAVTVDYVVLAAAVVGLAASFFLAIDTQTRSINEMTAARLAEFAADQ